MDRYYSHHFGLKFTAGVLVCLGVGVVGIILIATGASRPNSTTPDIITVTMYEEENHGPVIRTLWPNGIVPFILDPLLDDNNSQQILWSIKLIEEKTCVNFLRKEKSDKNWVQFVRNDLICSDSPLGLDISRTGMRKIQIGKNCFNSSVIQRMLGRILGLDYKETRPDRDQFIRFEPECEKILKIKNISVEIPIGDHHEAALNVFFDYTSHMLRRTTCLEPLLNGRINLGSADDENTGTFSVLDIEKLNAMYNCTGCRFYRFLPSEKIYNSSIDHFQAVIGGFEINGYSPAYVCRVYQLGAILIGKVTTMSHGGVCWVEDRGHQHSYNSSYEILTNKGGANLVWRRRNLSWIPTNAVVGGRTQDRESVYIGRCRLDYSGREIVVTGSISPSVQTFKVPFFYMASVCPRDRQEILVCDE